MVRAITVRSRADLNSLAGELSKDFTVVFNDDDNFLTMKGGVVVKRFRARTRGPDLASRTGNTINPRQPQNGHVLLLASGLANGIRQEFRLLSDGLSRGERCVYATHQEASAVEEQLAKSGIEVERFKNEGLLHIMELSDPFQEKAGYAAGVSDIIDEIMKLNPDRVVSWRWIRDISNKDQNTANMEVERNVDAAMKGDAAGPEYAALQGFKGLLICTYLFGQTGTKINCDWLVNHVSHHDSAIFANSDGTLTLSR